MKIFSLDSIKGGFLAVAFGVLTVSCSDMNDLHREYMERGETIYIGKVDSAHVFSGKNRVKIKFWSSDPRATLLRVYWMSRTDSMDFAIPPGGAIDPTEVTIPDISENTHSFEMVTLTKDLKYRSIGVSETGNVYGARYQTSLLDRSILSAVYSATKKEWVISWLGEVENGVNCDIMYTDSTGVVIHQNVPMKEKQTVIKDPAKDMKYRTSFLPEPTAIDLFYTAYKPVVN